MFTCIYTLVECSNRSLFKFTFLEKYKLYPYEIFTVSFQDDFLLVAATKSWNLLKTHSCETKGYFHGLPHVHRVQ